MKESFGSNLRKIITGGAIIGAGLIPKESDAQSGFIGKVKEIVKDKIEVVSDGVKDKVKKEHKEYPQEQQENKKDSMIYNNKDDKEGFKYPFDKEYKSDENFHRTVAYSHDFTLEGAHEDAFFEALIKIKEENDLSVLQPISVLEESYFKNTKTGIITSVIAIEVPKKEESKRTYEEPGFIGETKDKDKNKKDSIIYNWSGDKIGFKYPFEKVYKSDENFYRTVAYGNMKSAGIGSQSLVFSEETAKMNALFNILKTEMNIEGDIKIYKESYGSTQIKNGDKKIDLGEVKIIDKVTFKDTQTGVYTTVIAVEVLKDRIKIEKIESTNEIEKKLDQTFSGELPDSTNWQEVQVEKPTESPLGNKPEKQPEYNPSVKKKDYHATFEDFEKAQQAEFDNYKKSRESDFEKYKKSQEEKFKKFQENK